MGAEQDILMLSCAPYDNLIPTTIHEMAHRLARRHRVVWVDPCPVYIAGPLSFLARGARFTALNALRHRGSSGSATVSLPSLTLKGPVVIRRDGMDIVRPRWHLPLHADTLWSSRLNQAIEAAQLARISVDLAVRRPTLISFRPDSDVLVRRLAAARRLYYCLDRWEDFPWAKPAIVRTQEDAVLRQVDRTIAITDELATELTVRGADAITVRNGVDVDLFAAMMRESHPAPAEVAGRTRPIVGFVGSLTGWIDLELLAGIARARPHWTLLLVGPAGSADLRPLAALPNVIMPGLVPRDRLAPYLQIIDVALVPFRINELTRSASPLKLYEYLASGLPVVSSALPEALRCSPPVYVAEGLDGFIGAIEAALHCPPGRREEGFSVAHGASWDKRVEEVARLLTPPGGI